MASDEDLEGDFNGSISVDLHDIGDLWCPRTPINFQRWLNDPIVCYKAVTIIYIMATTKKTAEQVFVVGVGMTKWETSAD